ncbi:hypothetical protein [Azospirillum baldaniorum]|uniref:Uncharacterized protein n=1 Tax=Azospirillum baldaniorum TaxID=1064539 RepID=A0A9P1JVF8_9PROT|nr:hypothetical protein [Azospirillum baldaniorum]CCD00432.1 exported protein of unknown function [Azospirillum baldaniorum]
MSRNTPMMRTLIAATALLPVLLAGTGCAPLGSERPGAILEKVADGDYDVGIRYPAKRARYVMIVEEDEDGFVVTNRPAAAREVDTAPAPVVAQPAAQRPRARPLRRGDRQLVPPHPGGLRLCRPVGARRRWLT